jgi:hypothetical protein
MPQNDQALLVRLKNAGVEFVVIGGFCGVYYGVPMITYDLDICCPFTDENLTKIESAVRDLHPIHRLAANKLSLEVVPPSPSMQNLYLETDLGILDCLSEVLGVGNYQTALEKSIVGKFSYGEFRFLTIDALIDAKSAAGRSHDMRAVGHLRALREKMQSKKATTPD